MVETLLLVAVVAAACCTQAKVAWLEKGAVIAEVEASHVIASSRPAYFRRKELCSPGIRPSPIGS
jgi:hypothetical protein